MHLLNNLFQKETNKQEKRISDEDLILNYVNMEKKKSLRKALLYN